MHGHLSLPIPLFLPFRSAFISFIFLLSVPQALITPPSRLTSGWNWDWQSGLMVAGHLGLKREKKKGEMSNLSLCEWSYHFLGIDLCEWALELYNFRGAVRLDWTWKLKSNFTQNPWNSILAWTKPCGVTKTPLNSLIISQLVFDRFQRQNHSSLTNLPVPFSWQEYEVQHSRHSTWSFQKADLSQCHFNWV